MSFWDYLNEKPDWFEEANEDPNWYGEADGVEDKPYDGPEEDAQASLDDAVGLQEDWDKIEVDGKPREIEQRPSGLITFHNWVPEPEKKAPVSNIILVRHAGKPQTPKWKVSPHSVFGKELLRRG